MTIHRLITDVLLLAFDQFQIRAQSNKPFIAVCQKLSKTQPRLVPSIGLTSKKERVFQRSPGVKKYKFPYECSELAKRLIVERTCKWRICPFAAVSGCHGHHHWVIRGTVKHKTYSTIQLNPDNFRSGIYFPCFHYLSHS